MVPECRILASPCRFPVTDGCWRGSPGHPRSRCVRGTVARRSLDTPHTLLHSTGNNFTSGGAWWNGAERRCQVRIIAPICMARPSPATVAAGGSSDRRRSAGPRCSTSSACRWRPCRRAVRFGPPAGRTTSGDVTYRGAGSSEPDAPILEDCRNRSARRLPRRRTRCPDRPPESKSSAALGSPAKSTGSPDTGSNKERQLHRLASCKRSALNRVIETLLRTTLAACSMVNEGCNSFA